MKNKIVKIDYKQSMRALWDSFVHYKEYYNSFQDSKKTMIRGNHYAIVESLMVMWLNQYSERIQSSYPRLQPKDIVAKTPLYLCRKRLTYNLRGWDCSEKTVYNHIMRLVEAGIICKKVHHGPTDYFELWLNPVISGAVIDGVRPDLIEKCIDEKAHINSSFLSIWKNLPPKSNKNNITFLHTDKNTNQKEFANANISYDKNSNTRIQGANPLHKSNKELNQETGLHITSSKKEMQEQGASQLRSEGSGGQAETHNGLKHPENAKVSQLQTPEPFKKFEKKAIETWIQAFYLLYKGKNFNPVRLQKGYENLLKIYQIQSEYYDIEDFHKRMLDLIAFKRKNVKYKENKGIEAYTPSPDIYFDLNRGDCNITKTAKQHEQACKTFKKLKSRDILRYSIRQYKRNYNKKDFVTKTIKKQGPNNRIVKEKRQVASTTKLDSVTMYYKLLNDLRQKLCPQDYSKMEEKFKAAVMRWDTDLAWRIKYANVA